MVQVTGFSNSNASGEIAPEAWERSDLEQVATGCEAAFNFIGLTTGAIVSRGGFYRVGAAKYQDKAHRKFGWNLSDGEGLVLEFGDLYARVWTARGAPIETSPGVPYEFAQPYSEADLAGLRIKQVGDIGYITSRGGLLNTTLKRLANNSWVVTTLALRNGPWLPENIDATRLLTFTDLGAGDWQVDASFSHFVATDLDAQILARPPGGGPGLRTWAPNTAVAAALQIISVGRIYETTAGGTTGNTPPTHDQGTVSDGAVDWTFLHDGATPFLITSYVSATRVIAQPQGTAPFASLTATPNWSDLALSATHSRPTAQVAVREERLAFAGSAERPDTIDFTRTAGFTPDYADFKPGLGTGLVVDDDAARVTLGDIRARIVWMTDGLALVVGTTEAEWVVSGATLDDPISPASTKPRRVSGYGSADVMPVVVQGPPSIILHVARGGTTLRELTLDAGTSGLGQGRDLSILAQHVWGLGVRELAWSRPDNNLWVLLADGSLACLTYHYEHGVIGVRRQPMGGGWLAEGIATAPDAEGRDRLHVAAVRSKDGNDQRACFVLAPRSDGMFLDGAGVYEGAATTTISGLSHYDGEAVGVLADGAFVEGITVSGGAITLPEAASKVFVGPVYLRRYKSLPFDPRRDGGVLAKRGRPSQMWVVLDCVDAVVRAERQDEDDDRVIYEEHVLSRRASDTVPVVRRKRAKVALGEGADRDVRVIVETYQPFDLAVYAVRPVWETS